LADENGKKFSRFWLHHVANPPNTLAKTVGRLWSDVRGEVWSALNSIFFVRFINCFAVAGVLAVSGNHAVNSVPVFLVSLLPFFLATKKLQRAFSTF
jgi:hypothetical protein